MPSLIKSTCEVQNTNTLDSITDAVITSSANISTSTTENLPYSVPSCISIITNNVPPTVTTSNPENGLFTESTYTNTNSSDELFQCQASISHLVPQPLEFNTSVAITNSITSTDMSNIWQSSHTDTDVLTTITNEEIAKPTISLKLVKSSVKHKRPSSTVEWISGRSTSPIILSGLLTLFCRLFNKLLLSFLLKSCLSNNHGAFV